MKKLFITSSAIVLLLALGSWGFLVHRTIHQISIYSLPKPLQLFFGSEMDYLVYNSVRPDVRRKDDPKRKPNTSSTAMRRFLAKKVLTIFLTNGKMP
jgi:hypothetical protein